MFSHINACALLRIASFIGMFRSVIAPVIILALLALRVRLEISYCSCDNSRIADIASEVGNKIIFNVWAALNDRSNVFCALVN